MKTLLEVGDLVVIVLEEPTDNGPTWGFRRLYDMHEVDGDLDGLYRQILAYGTPMIVVDFVSLSAVEQYYLVVTTPNDGLLVIAKYFVSKLSVSDSDT